MEQLVNAKRVRVRDSAAVATYKGVWRFEAGSWSHPHLIEIRAGITCNGSSVCQRNRCKVGAGRLAFKLEPQPFEPRHNAPGARKALPERSAKSAAGALLAAPTGKNGMNGDTEEEEEDSSDDDEEDSGDAHVAYSLQREIQSRAVVAAHARGSGYILESTLSGARCEPVDRILSEQGLSEYLK